MKICFLISWLCVPLMAAERSDELDWHKIASLEYSESDALKLSKHMNNKTSLLARNGDGRTAFHVAINNGKFLLAKKLVDKKLKVLNQQDLNFYTPLHTAVENMSEVGVELLIELGADPSVHADGKNALEFFLDDIQNFRRRDLVHPDFWAIGKNIIKIMAPKMSTAELGAGLLFAETMKSSNVELRNLRQKYILETLQNAKVKRKLSERSLMPVNKLKKRRAEVLDTPNLDEPQAKRKKIHTLAEISRNICISCNFKLNRNTRKRFVKIDDQSYRMCAKCSRRGENNGFCPKCKFAYYRRDREPHAGRKCITIYVCE
jgi:hypothetical protein